VILKGAGVSWGDVHPDGTFVPTCVLTTAVVVVWERRGDWLGTGLGGQAGWFAADAAVPLEDAPDFFSDRIRATPEDATLWTARAVAWQELGQPDRAVADFTEAIRLWPEAWWAYQGRGTAWVTRQDPARAVADYSEVIRLNPTSSAGYVSRAWALSEAGQHVRAVADSDEAIRLDPGCTLAFNNRAWARPRPRRGTSRRP
jgi:tetratricopeptide (TPR) repeat protein